MRVTVGDIIAWAMALMVLAAGLRFAWLFWPPLLRKDPGYPADRQPPIVYRHDATQSTAGHLWTCAVCKARLTRAELHLSHGIDDPPLDLCRLCLANRKLAAEILRSPRGWCIVCGVPFAQHAPTPCVGPPKCEVCGKEVAGGIDEMCYVPTVTVLGALAVPALACPACYTKITATPDDPDLTRRKIIL